jgi:Ca2+-binding EF-hand superfamily protein
MRILSPELKHFHVRNLFHEIDLNQDGVIDVDEFLETLEIITSEQEE